MLEPLFAARRRSFANRGFAIDGGTAVVNGVLLLVLIALAGERIFGLDKVGAYCCGFSLQDAPHESREWGRRLGREPTGWP